MVNLKVLKVFFYQNFLFFFLVFRFEKEKKNSLKNNKEERERVGLPYFNRFLFTRKRKGDFPLKTWWKKQLQQATG